VNINRIREVVPWFKSSYQLRMDDKKQTEIPVSRAQTKRLRELFGLLTLARAMTEPGLRFRTPGVRVCAVHSLGAFHGFFHQSEKITDQRS
jgi:hypothetical protein